MIRLDAEQHKAVQAAGNVVVTACPGSGKTRVLTARVLRAINEVSAAHERIVALTFTNRAADEVRTRIAQIGADTGQLWVGTIHAFALQWILRPYAPYIEECRYGFRVAEESLAGKLLDEEKVAHKCGRFDEVDTGYSRDGAPRARGAIHAKVVSAYKRRLRDLGLIDYDDVLHLAHDVLRRNLEICESVGSVVSLFCVDEVQDLQDLQYAIMSRIHARGRPKPTLFFVGDADQSIYESLGAVTKTPSEIAHEFNLGAIEHMELGGNYRSTQRIVDFCRALRAGPKVRAVGRRANERGIITFENQTLHKDGLSDAIAGRINDALAAGVATHQICVVAPQWSHVLPIARKLMALLPTVDFDAPGLSPLHSSRESIWFQVSRLLLTAVSPKSALRRHLWALELLDELQRVAQRVVPEELSTARGFLRMLNRLKSLETNGIRYLRDVFDQLLRGLGWDGSVESALAETKEEFLAAATKKVESRPGEMPVDVESLRRLFKTPSGVVVNTCHGVKGEEYDTVIAFGLLRGYIPHWDVIINGSTEQANEQESKLLYVTGSRAMRCLHLIAESGRQTQGKRRYETSNLMSKVAFAFDSPNGKLGSTS